MNTPRAAKGLDGLYIDADANKALCIAEIFCEMDAGEQAKFFDYVQHLSSQWRAPAVFQWREMESTITPAARAVLKDMYDHTGQ